MRRLLLPLLLTCAASAGAHELGPLQVRVSFLPGGKHVVDVRLDEEHLPAQAAPLPGSEATPRELAGAAELPDRTRTFVTAYLERARARFDGQDVSPLSIEVQPATGTGAQRRAIVRWTGRTPPGAREFTWQEGVQVPFHAISLGASGETPVQQWIRGGDATAPFALAAHVLPTTADVVTLYLGLGFTHILPLGLDHILFVLGLFLLSRAPRPLLLQVSAFTLAHTASLALSTKGLVSLPSSIVEPLIAVSIVYVAVENLLTAELRPWRPAVVFLFGLLHGMGFAGVLREVGIPASAFGTALVAFNVGVEGGQLAVLLLAFAATALLGLRGEAYRRWIVVPGSLLIAAAGGWWSIERVLS